MGLAQSMTLFHCYYIHRLRRRTLDVERLRWRNLVNELFAPSQRDASRCSIVIKLPDLFGPIEESIAL
ncbi:hypothetical protein A3218_00695 [Pseudomonas chlororaphis]|nr:hypothetical protein A3218_00695 [Pseudomonas chlororaphis]